MKRIILVRHAITDLAGKLCGQLDSPVNENGRLQLREISKQFALERIDRVYTSNLCRAIQTAEAIANPLELSLVVDEDLREISFGDWEGCVWADLRLRSEEARQWLDPSSNSCAPNGEPMQHFRQRVLRALGRIASENPDLASIVVTHLGVLRVAFVSLADVSPESELLRGVEYCSAYEFLVNKGHWTFSRRLIS